MGRSSAKPRYADRRPMSVVPKHAPESPILSRQNGVAESNFVPDFHPNFYRSMLYVLGEKTQMKVMFQKSLKKFYYITYLISVKYECSVVIILKPPRKLYLILSGM